MAKIRVMVVDDHRVVRFGLKMALGIFDDLEFVGEASNGLEAVKLCDELLPDVILMDLMMPVLDGVGATRLIRQSHPATYVIAMTASQETKMIENVLEAGASECLLKNASIDELARSIIQAAKAS